MIHSSTGQLIRKLNLVFKRPGDYTSRTNAARWDGKNEYGEKVSCGIYFYTIRAGDYTETRKMTLKN